MHLIYSRTINTHVGPIKLRVENDPVYRGYRYTYSYVTAQGHELTQSAMVCEDELAYARDPDDLIQYVEQHALRSMGAALVREV